VSAALSSICDCSISCFLVLVCLDLFSIMPPKPKKGAAKRVAATPTVAKKGVQEKKQANPLFEKRTRNFGIGQSIQPKRDLSRFVRWPKYVRLQRQRTILYKRLKIPPPINQFTMALDRQTASQVLRILDKYRPETKQARKKRLQERAKERAEGKDDAPTKSPPTAQFGVNKVTRLIEQKKAQLVVIAHDVDPIEIVIYLPALCRKMGVPYCIIKGRARLGRAVHRKTCSVLALSTVNAEDKPSLAKVVDAVKTNFNERYDEIRRHWGGGLLGAKSQSRINKLERAKAKEIQQKHG